MGSCRWRGREGREGEIVCIGGDFFCILGCWLRFSLAVVMSRLVAILTLNLAPYHVLKM